MIRVILKFASQLTATFLVVAGLFLVGSSFLNHQQTAPLSVYESSQLEPGTSPSEWVAPSAGETLLSSWYTTPGAYVAYGLLVLGVVVAFVWWRTLYLERRREELEQRVATRTNEVRRQKRQLKSYNRELLRTNEQLRETIDEKSNLLGVAAHDLKNPLFGIRALSEIVLESEDLTDKGRRKLNLIRESAEDSLDLIDELLASAASSTQETVEAKPVDVAALTQWVVHSFEPQAERKDQTLRCSVADKRCIVEGDKRKLREAVANLVSNALKYSPPGEAVDVFVNRKNGTVQIAVEDAGPGLSETDQKRMFAPFQRLSPTPTGDESSSGLGLYIVKQIAGLHEGTVEVDSTPGEGSTFMLRLPASSPESDSPSTVDPPTPTNATETPPTDAGSTEDPSDAKTLDRE